MLVRVVRLFAGVVLLACLVTIALFIWLYSWRSGVVYVGGELQAQHRAVDLVLTHRDVSFERVERHNLSKFDIESVSCCSSYSDSNSTDDRRSALPHEQPVPTNAPVSASLSGNVSSLSASTTTTSTASTLSAHPTSSNISTSYHADTSSGPPPASHSDAAHFHLSLLSPEPNTSTPHLQANGKLSVPNKNSNKSSTAPTRQHPLVHENTPHSSVSKPTSQMTVRRGTTGSLLTTHTASTRHISTTAVPKQEVLSQGYVLAVNYYEQQTMGLRNMMQLQCWAQSLKLQVVKPVMHDSFLRTPLDSSQQAHFLKFEDSFDLEEWNHHVERLGYALLIQWSEFLTWAPRDVVLVLFEHPSVSMLKSRQKSGQGLLHSPDSLQYTSGCSSKWPTPSESHFLKLNGFHVVHTACFNFFHGDQLSLDTFNQHILAGHSPGSVTVVMQTWRGISSAQRVLLKDVCQNTALVQEHLALSPRLAQQADQFIHKYLGGRQYLAIMGRLEITQLTVHKKVPVVPFCLEETLSQWRDFKKETHLEKTFLAIDIGRYGSKKYRSALEPGLATAFRKFFQTLFGTSLTMREWEKRFESVAGIRDAGYIGLLQKTLVTRAQCILFVGGGAFQRHALHLYKQLHPDPKEQCYRIVKKCTRNNKLS